MSVLWASLVAQTVKNPPAMWETWVQPLNWEDLLEEEMATGLEGFPGESLMDRRAWWASVHGVIKSRT